MIHWATGHDLSRYAGTTGGQIVGRFRTLVNDGLAVDQDVLKRARDGADRLIAANESRNDIFHSRPATINRQQRLNRWAPSKPNATPGPIQAEDLEQFIGEVEAAHALINQLHEALRPPQDDYSPDA